MGNTLPSLARYESSLLCAELTDKLCKCECRERKKERERERRERGDMVDNQPNKDCLRYRVGDSPLLYKRT